MSARQSTRDASMTEAARNDRRAARASAAAGLLLALAAALIGAWALIQFATPCKEYVLC